MLLSVQQAGRHGKKRRRCRWARAARPGARRGAAPCSGTILEPGETRGPSGIGITGCVTRHTARHRSRSARRRARAASRGAWRGCCTPDWACWRSASSSTSSAPGIRVSRRQRSGWWAPRSSWPVWRAACCGSPSVSSQSPAVVGGPTIRRAEDWMVAVKAKRCHWLAGRAQAPPSALPHADWTRLPVTSAVCPAGRRTSVCADTALIRSSQSRRKRKVLLQRYPPHCLPRILRLYICNRVPSSRSRCSRSQSRRAVPRPATCRSRVPTATASSYSAPRSYAPNQAINSIAILPFAVPLTDRL